MRPYQAWEHAYKGISILRIETMFFNGKKLALKGILPIIICGINGEIK